LPYSHLDFHLRRFHANANEHNSKDLASELRNILNRKDLPDFLVEELNHFRCISKSRVASLFHLRQFLVRIGFSETIRRQFRQGNPKHCRAFLEVVKYWLDYAEFHYVSMPWIEAQHLYVTDQGREDFSSPLYEARIADVLKQLIQSNVDKNESFFRVANIIDNLYGLIRQCGIQCLTKIDINSYFKDTQKNSMVGIQYALIETASTLSITCAWPRLRGIIGHLGLEHIGDGRLNSVCSAVIPAS
jgi:hypothetical protein